MTTTGTTATVEASTATSSYQDARVQRTYTVPCSASSAKICCTAAAETSLAAPVAISSAVPSARCACILWVSIAVNRHLSDIYIQFGMDEYQTLIRIMQRRGQRKEEPLDDVLITAAPALLKTSVMMLLQENVFTPKEFMNELSQSYGLSINPLEVEYLLDLPAGTLSSPQIIDITTLQIKRHGKEG